MRAHGITLLACVCVSPLRRLTRRLWLVAGERDT